ncbi:MAG: hypothetical protein ACI9UA_004579 [Pseudoalteromonas tetraodonis]|jgi:hypothetical protein
MSKLLERVKSAFATSGWECVPVEGREVVTAAFEAHHAKVSLYVQAFEEMGAISTVAEASLAATPAVVAKVGEMLMRVNQELTVGNFEMDWDRGMIYFRVTNVFEEPAAATDQLLASLVRAAVVEMDRLTPYLAVIARTDPGEVDSLDVPQLLARRDLLPDVEMPAG